MKLAIILAIIFVGIALVFAVQNMPIPPVDSFANDNGNTNAALNTNTTVNQNTNSSASTLTVNQVTSNAAQYKGKTVCISGYYQNSFEFSVLGNAPQRGAVSEPYIWVTGDVQSPAIVCTKGSEGEETCIGPVTTCGGFDYKADGGFGHVGAYKYSLDRSDLPD